MALVSPCDIYVGCCSLSSSARPHLLLSFRTTFHSFISSLLNLGLMSTPMSEFHLSPAPSPPRSNRLKRATPILIEHLNDLSDLEPVDLGEPQGPIITGRFPYALETDSEASNHNVPPTPARPRISAGAALARLFRCHAFVYAFLSAMLLLVIAVALAYGLAVGFTALGRLAILSFGSATGLVPLPPPGTPRPLVTAPFLNALPAGCFVVIPPVWAFAVAVGWTRVRNPAKDDGGRVWLTFLGGATFVAGGLVGALGQALVLRQGDPTPGAMGVNDALQAGLLGMGMVFVSLCVVGIVGVVAWLAFAKRFAGRRRY